MSADQDGDSQMLSSASSSSGPATPPLNNQQSAHPTSSTLSPPDSQHRSNSNAMSNANGKRPLNTISNGPDEEEMVVTSSSPTAQPKARQEFATKVHERSGYSWNRVEDEPGYAWNNKKAVSEFHQAWDNLVQKDHMVKGRYGDPFEAADRERAVMNSLKQQ
ncbi:uncharacterized protein LTR77_006525 [Saxophila tyrrhenica]|uniref:Uncharacterized protein n=1 Tax=Saxophila tyrrhenica TaxID=1690608 RepID=A0AAV9P5I2_9PEZI|nr:hypothetical protein LTR77_006525 [Saxophila tyrrhenica]